MKATRKMNFELLREPNFKNSSYIKSQSQEESSLTVY